MLDDAAAVEIGLESDRRRYAIYDTVRFIAPRVNMIGTGWVASAGALIYLASPLGDRFCLPNTRFLLHQPAGGVNGRESDVAIQAEQILRIRERINPIIAAAKPVSRSKRSPATPTATSC